MQNNLKKRGQYMNEKTLARDEFIGLKVKILECTDPAWEGQTGLIIDETKNTFHIKTKNKTKILAKKTAVFEFTINDEKIMITGEKIAFRPEDRIKKIR
jgi:ribonuclease P protein subunit POP4